VPIEYVTVASSTIESVGYDPESMTLAITFRDGREYHYYNVPASVFEGLRTASSPGRFLDTEIKKAGYGYARVR